MIQKSNFFNVDAMEQGIRRELAEGLSTRIFPGELYWALLAGR